MTTTKTLTSENDCTSPNQTNNSPGFSTSEIKNSNITPEIEKALRNSTRINIFTYKNKIPLIGASSTITVNKKAKNPRKGVKLFLGDMMDRVIIESVFQESAGLKKFENKERPDEPNYVIFLPITKNDDLRLIVDDMEKKLHSEILSHGEKWWPREKESERKSRADKFMEKKGIARLPQSEGYESYGKQVSLKCGKFTKLFFSSSKEPVDLKKFPLNQRGIYTAEWLVDHFDMQNDVPSPIIYLQRLILHDDLAQQEGSQVFDNILCASSSSKDQKEKGPETLKESSEPDQDQAQPSTQSSTYDSYTQSSSSSSSLISPDSTGYSELDQE